MKPLLQVLALALYGLVLRLATPAYLLRLDSFKPYSVSAKGLAGVYN